METPFTAPKGEQTESIADVRVSADDVASVSESMRRNYWQTLMPILLSMLKRKLWVAGVIAFVVFSAVALLLWKYAHFGMSRYEVHQRVLYLPPRTCGIWPALQSNFVMDLFKRREVFNRTAACMGLSSGRLLSGKMRVELSQKRTRMDVIGVALYGLDFDVLSDAHSYYIASAIDEYMNYWTARIDTWRVQQAATRKVYDQNLVAIANEMTALMVAPSYSPPSVELARLQTTVTTQLGKLDALVSQIADVKMQLSETGIFLRAMNVDAVQYLPRLQEIAARREACQKELSRVQQLYTERNPKMKMVVQLKKELDEEYATFVAEHHLEKLDEQMVGRIQDLRTAQIVQTQQLQTLQLQKDLAQQQIDQSQKAIEVLLPKSARYDALTEQQATLKKMLQKMDDDEELVVTYEKQLPETLVQEDGSPSVRRNKNFMVKVIAIAAVVALVVFFGILVVYLVLKLIYGRVRSRRELSFFLGGVTALARLPIEEQSPSAERARLQVIEGAEQAFGFPSVILVLSTQGCGAYNYEAYFKEMKNLGHTLFVLSLSYEKDTTKVLQPSDGFNLITCTNEHTGVVSMIRHDFILPNRLELLNADLVRLRQQYDCVFLVRQEPIDGPELFVRQLTPYIDGIALIASYAQTPFRVLRQLAKWRKLWNVQMAAILRNVPIVTHDMHAELQTSAMHGLKHHAR